MYIKMAIDTWGADAQIGQLFEEMGELQTAISRYHYRNRGTLKDIAEEIVDVSIMVREMTELYDIHELVSHWLDIKTEKLGKQLKLGKNYAVKPNGT